MSRPRSTSLGSLQTTEKPTEAVNYYTPIINIIIFKFQTKNGLRIILNKVSWGLIHRQVVQTSVSFIVYINENLIDYLLVKIL